MKIAFVVEKADRRGGQNRVVTELALRLSARHEVHIYCFEAADRVDGVEYHIMRCPLKHRPIMQEYWIPIASRRAIDPDDYDIINAQGGNCPIANTTLLHTAQHWLSAAKHEVFFNQPAMSWWERWIRKWWQKKAIENERRIVEKCRGSILTVSEELRRYIIETWDVDETDVTAAPNGVDHDRFYPGLRDEYRQQIRRELGVDDGEFLLLFMGGLWREKGVDRLLEAMEIIADPDIHLAIVGSGDTESVAEFMPDGYPENIHFTGHQQPEGYFGAADAFVLASRVEGLPLVMVEAAASGLPLIVTPVGGSGALVEEDVTGYIVDGDPAQIAAHIRHLADNPDKARRMGQQAHERSLAFSWDRQAEIVEEVFERTAARSE